MAAVHTISSAPRPKSGAFTRQFATGRQLRHIRDLLLREGQLLPRGRTAWTESGMAALTALAQPLTEVSSDQLWRGELGVELAQLTELQQQILIIHAKLDQLAAADPRVALLRTIPGVGPRLAEAIVTMFDDVTRFATAGQVGSYIGMVPKSFDSGETERSGRITRHGNRLVRSLLVGNCLGCSAPQRLGPTNLPTHQWRQKVAAQDCYRCRRQKIVSAMLGHAAASDSVAVANQRRLSG